MKAFRLYRAYRQQHLRRAWTLSGMNTVAWSAARGVALLIALGGGLMAITQQAQAIQASADNRVAARLAAQAGEIDALRKIVAKCLGDREGVLIVGGEWFLCKAVSIGEVK